VFKPHRNICIECNTEQLVVVKKGYCARCNHKIKGKVPYKIKPMSDKRTADNKVYLELRKEFLKNNRVCPITLKPTVEVHHLHGGKDRDKYFLDTTTWLAVSREGHLWVHNNPIEAREKGYLK